ncbi:hypothetical protein CR513_44907, partial [Mucuna pruriens]
MVKRSPPSNSKAKTLSLGKFVGTAMSINSPKMGRALQNHGGSRKRGIQTRTHGRTEDPPYMECGQPTVQPSPRPKNQDPERGCPKTLPSKLKTLRGQAKSRP